MSAREAYKVLHELASLVSPIMKAQGIDVKAKARSDPVRKESVEELVHSSLRKLANFENRVVPPLPPQHRARIMTCHMARDHGKPLDLRGLPSGRRLAL